MRTLLALAVLGFLLALLASALTPTPRKTGFTGLWEAVDSNDGSLRTLTITDPDQDGVLEVLAHDSYWSLCGDDRGLYRATGSVDRDGNLVVAGTVTCFETGIAVPVETIYEPFDGGVWEIPLGVPLERVPLVRASR